MLTSFVRSVFAPAQTPPEPLAFDALLAPVFEVARHSSSLVSGRHTVGTLETDVEIPNFLLLGQRGGGIPLRVALFSGFDAGREETVFALSRLLLQFEL